MRTSTKTLHSGRISERTQLLVLLFLMFAVIVFSRFAQAQNKTSAKATNEKRTTVNFEDQLVEGQTQKPELFYLLQQRNNGFKRLIKLRENFLPEMRKTAEDVSRKGNGN